MRYFLLAFSLILSVTACSDSSSNQSQYPVQIGAFSVKSESEANWTGVRAKVLSSADSIGIGDTLRYSQPDSLSMLVGQFSHRDSTEFAVIINDSTLSWEEIDSLGVHGQHIEVHNGSQPNPISFANGAIGNGSVVDGSSDILNIQFNGAYDCSNGQITGNAEMVYSLLIDDDENNPYRTYILEVPGFEHVLDHIICHEPI